MNISYIKDTAKLIKLFSKINIWVFWYTAPKEDKRIQKNPKNMKLIIKNIIYLRTNFPFSLLATFSEAVNEGWVLIFIKFLSDKNNNLIIIQIAWDIAKDINIFGRK